MNMNMNLSLSKFLDIIQDKITKLFDNGNESSLTSEITEIAKNNWYQYREIGEIIINRFNTESNSEKRKKLINIIDSLIKTCGQDYINLFTPHIVNFFKMTYLGSTESSRIHLFKIYYTWKYLINPSILDELQKELKLDIMKQKIAREDPGLLEKYDNYNERMKKSIENRNAQLNQINPMENIHTIITEDKKIIQSENYNYFSKSSSDAEFSNKESNKEKRKTKNTNLTFDNSSNNNNNSNNNSSNKKKQKFRVPTKKTFEEEGSNFNYSKNDDSVDQEKNKNILLMIQKIQKNQEKAQSHSNINNNINNINNEFLKKKRNSSPKTPYEDNKPNINKTQSLINKKSNFQTNSPNRIIKQNYPSLPPQPNHFDNILSSFIDKTNYKIKPSMTFFSAISKIFTEASLEAHNIPTTKTGRDLFESKESKDLFDKIYQYSFKVLFHSLRNICPICGFRVKFYNRFIEHLDIHFHYNYLKHRSMSSNKVLSRKMGCNKQAWITNSYLKANSSYTLNAILYYKNDSDSAINNQIVKSNEKEDNHEDIYPIGTDVKYCYYCGENFRKKYFTEYHFWFYVNVVKIKIEEEAQSKQILLHKNCIEEFNQFINCNFNIDKNS